MNDEQALRRCIELARISVEHGSHPFGSLITRDEELIAEGDNRVVTDMDATAHAEVVAMRNACRALGALNLDGCTLFTSCEPCWMCSCVIRELGVSRVVFAITSTRGGGYSGRFPILTDPDIERYGPPPRVTSGFMAEEAMALWREIDWPATRHQRWAQPPSTA